MTENQYIPAVSVIVPIYNVENYLKECVDSIRYQTMNNIEIILIDDGSPDTCPSMCDQFADEDSRIRVLHQANSGVSVARNNGIKMARGEWLMFVDGDDWIERNAIEALYRKNLEWDCDVITGARFLNYVNKEVVPENPAVSERCFSVADERINLLGNVLIDIAMAKTLFPEEMHNNVQLAPPWMKLFRRKLICENEIIFPENIKWAEDMIFNMEVILKARKIGFLNDMPLYHYRQRKGAVTKRLDVLSKEYMVTLTYMYERFIQKEKLGELLPYLYMECINCSADLLALCGKNSGAMLSQVNMIKHFAEENLCLQALLHTPVRRISIKNRWITAILLKNKLYLPAVLIARWFYRISLKKKDLKMFT